MARTWRQPPRLRVGEETEERHATWLELFYDLIFVVAVAQLAHNLHNDVSVLGFLRYTALFIPIWWSWVGFAYYATRFDTDDIVHRILTAVQMFFVAAMAVNVHNGLGSSSAGFALSYAGVRFILVIEYIRAGRSVPQARRLTRRYMRGFGLAAFIWFLSAFVPIPYRFWLWALGLIVDFGAPITAGRLHADLPPHTSHLPERFGLFTIIVLGETAAGVVRGVAEREWGIMSVASAALGLGTAFSLWWLYFETSGGRAIRAAVKQGRIWTYQAWIYAHLFLALGIAASGVGVERLILFSQQSALPGPDRWLFCGSVAISLLSLAVIHITTASDIVFVRFRSEIGAIYRISSAIIILLIAAVGSRMLPIVLAAVVFIICAIQVVLDHYEVERHG